MPLPERHKEEAKGRLLQVFRYLEALNEHRSPVKRDLRQQVWFRWFRDLPDHDSISLSTGYRAVGSTEREEAADEGDFILRVRRPVLTGAPALPDPLRQWVSFDRHKVDPEPMAREALSRLDDRGSTVIEQFEDSEERNRAWPAWLREWHVWAESERPARAAMKFFEDLYTMYGSLEKEGERLELVLGDGVLTWRRTGGGVFHPILLQRVQIVFDPSAPEFTIQETTHGVELYSALFSQLEDVDGRLVSELQTELEAGGYHPLDLEPTSAFLKRIVTSLSPRGEFREDGAAREEGDDPVLGRDRVLFLRTRSLGFPAAIQAVIGRIEESDDFPVPLVRVVGVDPPQADEPVDDLPRRQWTEPEDVLLSKEANREQVAIVERLNRHNSVLVQGPPGTGKSHTIANLIGHLLAQGKKVLVTSHTTKALRVLRRHVVEGLRPLCVSVLDNDLDSRRELEAAVQSIVEALSENEKKLGEEAEQLAEKRSQLLDQLEEVRQGLFDAKWAEYQSIVIAGSEWSPSDAARHVAVELGKHEWLPGPLKAGTPMPLSEGELIELYRTNTQISLDQEDELDSPLPDIETDALPRAETFSEMVRREKALKSRDLDFGREYWTEDPSVEGAGRLQQLLARMAQCVEPLADESSWQMAVIAAGRAGDIHRLPWENLAKLIREVGRKAAEVEEARLRWDPEPCSGMASEEQLEVLDGLTAHAERKGHVGKLAPIARPKWRRFLEGARVNGHRPSRVEHFRALRGQLELDQARETLRIRWKRQMEAQGGPKESDLGIAPEQVADQFRAAIARSLAWFDEVWKPVERECAAVGLQWQRFLEDETPRMGPHADLLRLHRAVTGRLRQVLSARIDAIWSRRIRAALGDLLDYIAVTQPWGATVAAERLRHAVTGRDEEAYSAGIAYLNALLSRRGILKRRRELLARLEASAPYWASSIRHRTGVHGSANVPGNAASGWDFRQLAQELERRSQLSDADALERKRNTLEGQLRDATADLISKFAWTAQLRRTHSAERQSLVGWADTVRRIGKGTGKRAPRLRAEARRKMAECQTAVPVWIMPLARVVDNFDFARTEFDVVIIDEASQSDVLALLVWYIGKKIVVVGDHEQVSPAAVGQNLTTVQNLIATYLQGIPNADLYDGRTSIYDLARQSFEGNITLLEHFRCVSDIIEFSNGLSYSGRILPLRDPSQVRLWPFVVPYRVSDATAKNKVNEVEAETVASLLISALEQAEYAGKTFGVISMVGEEQALRIEQLLLRYMRPDEHERRRIVCGNAAQFQGDERDVMFLSMVDALAGGPLALRQQDLFKQRFNVAASRARDQMWVVYSMDPAIDLKDGDLRLRLIRHAQDPGARLREIERKTTKAESPFERKVIEHLINAGFRVQPQFRVGYYRIDMVVDGGGKRLAVECDGDRFHTMENLRDDMARQATLERLGWRFLRIRGSEFFRDEQSAMNRVILALTEYGVTPEGQSGDPAIAAGEDQTTELRERVTRRAAELRQEWLDVSPVRPLI